jgi:cytochrome c biogenesis protein CcdA
LSYQDFLIYLKYSPILALAGAFFFGLLTSLGPCTFLRAATLFGLVGERPARKEGLAIAFSFVFGLGLFYSFFGIFASLLAKIVDISELIYPFAGSLLIILGLNIAGLLKVPLTKGPKILYKTRAKLSQKFTLLNSFLLGSSFAFMICPCCFPALLTIFSFTFALGKFLYGIILVAIFTFAHSIPLLLMGYFGHLAKKLAQVRKIETHFNLFLGIIIFVTGMVILWIS